MVFIFASLPDGNKARDKLMMQINILQYFCFDAVIEIFCGFVMPLDINKYRKYVDDYDLTEEQKSEMLNSIWSIMESFVDKAFGLHPVQQCQKDFPENDLQSPAEIVESKKYTSVFRKGSAPLLGQENESNKVKKVTRHHVRPK